MANEITLRVHNDGKGDLQSYECDLAADPREDDPLKYNLKLALLTTYGPSEEDAVAEMKNQIDAAVAYLQSIRLEVTSRTGYPTGTAPIKRQPYFG